MRGGTRPAAAPCLGVCQGLSLCVLPGLREDRGAAFFLDELPVFQEGMGSLWLNFMHNPWLVQSLMWEPAEMLNIRRRNAARY